MKPLFVFLISLFSLQAIAQETVTITVSVVNDLNGENVNAKITANSSNNIPVKNDDGIFYLETSRGQKVKINVEKEGFYAEERVVDTQTMLSDSENVEIRLSSRPFAVVVLQAIFPPGKKIQATSVSLLLNGKVIQTGTVTSKNQQFKTTVYQPGFYQIISERPEMEAIKDGVQVEVGTQANVYMIDLVFGQVGKDITLEFFDKQKNVINGNFIVSNDKDATKIEGVIKNGKGNVKLFSENKYEIITDVNGYLPTQLNLQNEVSPQRIELKKASKISILVEQNNTPVSADIKITSPAGKTFSLIANTKPLDFLPEETGTYKIVISKEGFKSLEDVFDVKTLVSQEITIRKELKADDLIYSINVFDDITKKPLKDALVKIFSDKNEAIDVGKPNETIYVSKDKKYFVEVSHDGYYDYTHNLDSETELKVYLKPNNKGIFKILVKNKKNNAVIDSPVLQITDASGNLIAADKKAGSFEAILLLNEPYTFKVGKNGFTTQNIKINEDKNKEIEVLLDPIEEGKYTIVALDSLSKEAIPYDLTLKVNDKVVTSAESAGLYSKTAVFDPNGTIEVNVSSKGYLNKKVRVKKEDLKNNAISVLMSRTFYPVKFVFENKLKVSQVQQVFFQLHTAKGQKVAYQFNKEIKGFTANLDPTDNFNLGIETFGFEPYVDSFEITEVLKNDLVYVISLIPLQEIKIAQKEIEPIKKVKPVKVEKPKRAIIEELPVDLNQLSSIFENPDPSKKYRLSEVHFEQSKPMFLDGYEDQLNKIGELMKQYPNNKVELIGYTDNVGNYKQNYYLSQMRAQKISSYIFNKFGITDERFILDGKGSEDPVTTNDTEENRALNRRVEIAIIPIN